MSDEKESTEQPPEQPAESAAELEIRLDQFLQLCGVPTGGQAKQLIQGGEVMVNGEVEMRRRKKLRIGDVVAFDGGHYDVAFDPGE